jgi:hypothetical protein
VPFIEVINWKLIGSSRTDQERFPEKILNMKMKAECPKGRLTLRLER